MAKLNQVIAIQTGLKSESYAELTKINKAVQRSELFNGFVKNYRRMDDEGEDLPGEQKHVQMTSQDVIRSVKETISLFWATEARKEWSNTIAKADVVVDGSTVLSDVPVTYLLFLEKQLNDMRKLIDNFPVLDPNEDWQQDVNSGLFKSSPVLTHRTKKVQRPLVLYDATPEHPAQTQIISEDVLVGHWETIKHSGSLPRPVKQQMLQRADKLIRAVKEAREAANSIEEAAIPSTLSESLLNYLFAESGQS